MATASEQFGCADLAADIARFATDDRHAQLAGGCHFFGDSATGFVGVGENFREFGWYGDRCSLFVWIFGHDFGYADGFERVDAVFAGEMIAAAGELFSKDRAGHDECRDEIGSCACEHEREQRRQSVGELE